MSVKAIFKSNLPSFNYMFKNGMAAIFIGGRFDTEIDWQIKELAAEVGEIGVHKSRHPYIFVDENESEIDTEAPTPMELIRIQARKEAREELLEEQARALNAADNVSTSESKDFAASLGNSNTIAQAGSAESTGEAVNVGVTATASAIAAKPAGASLANLKVGPK